METERGKKSKLGGIYYWLNQLRARHTVPRKAHAQQDPDQKEAFKRDMVDNLDRLDIPPNRKVRIWVEAEHR